MTTLEDFCLALHTAHCQRPFRLEAIVATWREDQSLLFLLRQDTTGATPVEVVAGHQVATEEERRALAIGLGLPDELSYVILAAQNGYDSPARRAMLAACGLLKSQSIPTPSAL